MIGLEQTLKKILIGLTDVLVISHMHKMHRYIHAQFHTCQIHPTLYEKVISYPQYKKELQFFKEFSIPWILAWEYNMDEARESFPFYLIRKYKVKWWNKFDTYQVTEQSIREFFATGQKVTKDQKKEMGEKIEIKKEEKKEEKEEKNLLEEFLRNNSEFLTQFNKFVETKKETSSSSSHEPKPFQDAQDPYEGYDFDMAM